MSARTLFSLPHSRTLDCEFRFGKVVSIALFKMQNKEIHKIKTMVIRMKNNKKMKWREEMNKQFSRFK
jgi:hypothetical protein